MKTTNENQVVPAKQIEAARLKREPSESSAARRTMHNEPM
jgi:hypothetical protein